MKKKLFVKAIKSIEKQQKLNYKKQKALSVVFVDEGGFPANIRYDNDNDVLERVLIKVLASVFNDKGNDETQASFFDSFIQAYIYRYKYMYDNNMEVLTFKGNDMKYYKINDENDLWYFLNNNIK